MNEAIHLPWIDGLSTKPDVDALIKAFPPETIKPGQWRATDHDVMQHIGECGGNRFRTVYTAWRRRLEIEHRVIIWREKKVGFFCPRCDQLHESTPPHLQRLARANGRHARRIAISVPTSDAERVTKETQCSLLHAISTELRARRQMLLPDTAIRGPFLAPVE